MSEPRLKPCKDCGTMASRSADSCPTCGAKSLNRNPGIIVITILVSVALAGLLVHSAITTINNSKQAANDILQIQQGSVATSTP